MKNRIAKFKLGINSIRAKIVLLLFLAGISSLIAFQVQWRPRVSQFVEDLIVEQSEENVATLVDSLIPFLIQNQYAAMVENLDQHKVLHPDLRYLELIRADGRKFYPVVGERPADLGSLFELRHAIDFRGEEVAVLSAFLDLSDTREALNAQLMPLGLSGVITFIALAVIVAIFLEFAVTRRIQRLAEVTEHLSSGQFDEALPSGGSDEIGKLVSSFERMRDNIGATQNSLQEARNQAESASKAKSEFLATMSHEIRTPLNGVIGMAGLLTESKLTDKQQIQVTTIRNSGKLLLNVINDILDFSKLEAGHLVLESNRFHLDSLLDSVGSMMELRIKASRNQLRLHCDTVRAAEFIGDDSRIRQILLNLLNNANKFTRHGLIEVRAELACSEEEVTRVRLSVKDNGIGIPMEKQETLFDRFTQVESSLSRRFEGTGLGLAICKQLVDLMNGKIGVESYPGLGSTFWFELDLEQVTDALPANSVEEAATPRPSTLAVEIDNRAPAGVNTSVDNKQSADEADALRILVVEDNVANQLLAVMLLEDLGHEVHVAANGIEAIGLLESVSYDIVFMDMQMPEMDGIEATRRIRQLDGSHADVPIVAMTANVLPEDRSACLKAGMVDFVTKPIDRNVLASKINQWGNSLSVA